MNGRFRQASAADRSGRTSPGERALACRPAVPAEGPLLPVWPTRTNRLGFAAKRSHAPRATEDGRAAEMPNDLDRVAACPQRMRLSFAAGKELPFRPTAQGRLFAAAIICSRAASATRHRYAESPGSAGFDQVGRAQLPDRNRRRGAALARVQPQSIPLLGRAMAFQAMLGKHRAHEVSKKCICAGVGSGGGATALGGSEQQQHAELATDHQRHSSFSGRELLGGNSGQCQWVKLGSVKTRCPFSGRRPESELQPRRGG